MATEHEMPIGMLFRKMFCAKCGAKLAKKQIRRTYQRGEPGFRNTLSDRSTVNVLSYTTVTYIYHCPNCMNQISYDDQVIVSKKQAALGKKVLSSGELISFSVMDNGKEQRKNRSGKKKQ